MDAILYYMSQERRASLGHEPERDYTSKERAVADELDKFKEAIMGLKEHMGETGGNRKTIPSELVETCLEAQAKIKAWVQRPDLAQNDHLLFELLHWNDEVNAAVGLVGVGQSGVVGEDPGDDSDADPLA